MLPKASAAVASMADFSRKDSEASTQSSRSAKSSSASPRKEASRTMAAGKAVLGGAASSIVGNVPKQVGISSDSGSMSSQSARDAYKRSNTSESVARANRGDSLLKDFDVGVMNGSDAAEQLAYKDRKTSQSSRTNSTLATDKSRQSSFGGDSDDSGGSRQSHISIKDLRKSLKEGRKGDIRGDQASVRMHLDDCTVEAEKERTTGKWKQSALTDFSKLVGPGQLRDGLVQGLEMYGMKAPNRCQEHLIPVLLYFLGKHLDGVPDEKGPVKSMVCIQGRQSGKTTSAVLAALAVVDPKIEKPQALLVSRSPKQEIQKLLRVLALSNPAFTFQAFEKDETGLDLDIDPSSPEVCAARAAHVLVGHPGRLRKALSSGVDMCGHLRIDLDAVKVLVVDDAHELFHGAAESADAPVAKPTTEMCLSGLPSGDKRGALPGDSSSGFAQSAVEDVVELCKILDGAGVHRMPYMVIAEESSDKAGKKMMKLLKSSMTSRKNLLSVESCTPPMKLIRAMKHYHAESKSTEWVRLFAGLVQALTFPRALIYCDDDVRIHQYLTEMKAMGIAVSANLPGATADARRVALSDFSSNKTQFLLTHSEPAVCQVMLPKVSCVFHFGIMSQLPSVYGVRLCPLDEKLKKESASILFFEQEASNSTGKASKEKTPDDVQPVVAKLQKMFTIAFMDMPLEMLPNKGTGRR